MTLLVGQAGRDAATPGAPRTTVGPTREGEARKEQHPMNTPADSTPAEDACHDCGGTLVEGSMALPLLGSPRFAYRLGTTEVTTEVAALMCLECGTVRLRGRNPDRIRNAVAAKAVRHRHSLGLPRFPGLPARSPFLPEREQGHAAPSPREREAETEGP